MSPLWILGIATEAHATCARTSVEVLIEHVHRAEDASANADPDGIRAARAALQEALPCAEAPLDAASAAAIHRLLAIAAFVTKDTENARDHWAAARSADPASAEPPEWLPPAHPLRRLIAEAEADVERGEGRPDVAIDGRVGAPVPTARPYIAQHFEGGVVVETRLLAKGESPPWPAPAPLDAEVIAGEPAGRGVRVAVLAQGLGFLRGDRLTGLGGLLGRLRVPVAAPVDLEAALGVAGSPAGDGRFAPTAWVGPVWCSGAAAGLWVSANALVTAHAEAALAIGGGLGVGIHPRVGSTEVVLETRAGWSHGAWAGVGVGVQR